MTEGNLYDKENFFEGYAQIRQSPINYNVLLEQPALLSLLGSVEGESVLDMGCGYGDTCAAFLEQGALRVLGIDVSVKMIEKALSLYADRSGLEFRILDMARITDLDERFDVITSSLAVHYLKDFGKLCKDVFSLLNAGGRFIFSQEHPLTTAPYFGTVYTRDPITDEALYYNLADYGRSGERRGGWLGEIIIKNYRPISEIITCLLDAGFILDAIDEPLPGGKEIGLNPSMRKELHKPSFFIAKCHKP